jgi:hypothetical protein
VQGPLFGERSNLMVLALWRRVHNLKADECLIVKRLALASEGTITIPWLTRSALRLAFVVRHATATLGYRARATDLTKNPSMAVIRDPAAPAFARVHRARHTRRRQA